MEAPSYIKFWNSKGQSSAFSRFVFDFKYVAPLLNAGDWSTIQTKFRTFHPEIIRGGIVEIREWIIKRVQPRTYSHTQSQNHICIAPLTTMDSGAEQNKIT